MGTPQDDTGGQDISYDAAQARTELEAIKATWQSEEDDD